MRPQIYTKDYTQLRSSGNERNNLSLQVKTQYLIPYHKCSALKNIHEFIPRDYLGICMFIQICMLNIKEKESKIRKRESDILEDLEEREVRKYCNCNPQIKIYHF